MRNLIQKRKNNCEGMYDPLVLMKDRQEFIGYLQKLYIMKCINRGLNRTIKNLFYTFQS